jgi:lipopolysaccharide/colanic/teichoic acid biosynthesis glycosyltransferase
MKNRHAAQPSEEFLTRPGKRAFDLVFTVLALPLAAPLLVVIALMA